MNGNANLNLGYLIIAESMFKQCLSIPHLYSEALKQLGNVYKAQDDVEKAIEHYRLAFEEDNDYLTAFEIG
jgi:tetratricopeptide (TPR) repeat protein